MRRDIEARAGIDAVDIYGLSEVMGPGVANECIETKDGPVIWEDHFYPEIIDPETGEVLPDGSEGELVFTTLTKEALPVIRYRTRDLTRLLPPTARSMRRMGKIVGRSDDMLIIRGVNVFPTQIEELVLQHGQLSGQYQLVVTREGALDEVRGALRAAAARTPAPTATPIGARAAAPHQDADRRQRHGRASALPDSIERTLVGKARRVIDKRPEVRSDAMYTQAMDTGAEGRAQGRALGRGGRARSSASRPASTPATSSRPRTGCPSTTARRWCARSASTRTPRSSACCPRATGSRARRR